MATKIKTILYKHLLLGEVDHFMCISRMKAKYWHTDKLNFFREAARSNSKNVRIFS